MAAENGFQVDMTSDGTVLAKMPYIFESIRQEE
jgi:hypothetical protein